MPVLYGLMPVPALSGGDGLGGGGDGDGGCAPGGDGGGGDGLGGGGDGFGGGGSAATARVQSPAQPLLVFCSAHVFWHFVQIFCLLQLFSAYAFSLQYESVSVLAHAARLRPRRGRGNPASDAAALGAAAGRASRRRPACIRGRWGSGDCARGRP